MHKAGRRVLAICSKKVLICSVVKGAWSGTAAAQMYSKELAPALRRAYPKKKSYLLVEDNDPTGYKSAAGKAAKAKAKIKVLPLPKRSPDLNPLDVSFWAEVNRRLRQQESRFDKQKKETRGEFITRLRRTILRIPSRVVAPMVHAMKRRCIAVNIAEGKGFEEARIEREGKQHCLQQIKERHCGAVRSESLAVPRTLTRRA